LGAVTAHAQTSIALPGDRVFPENIAASRDGTLYVGSVGQGGVFRIAPHSTEAQVWIKPGAFGTHSIFGVLADDKYTTRPTGVAAVGKTAWVSEGQLSYLFDPALKGQKPSLPFQISAVALPAAH
jgi:hypothetical protein